jgi:hypothetical protein
MGAAFDGPGKLATSFVQVPGRRSRPAQWRVRLTVRPADAVCAVGVGGWWTRCQASRIVEID